MSGTSYRRDTRAEETGGEGEVDEVSASIPEWFEPHERPPVRARWSGDLRDELMPGDTGTAWSVSYGFPEDDTSWRFRRDADWVIHVCRREELELEG